MALSASTVFEVRSTASDNNGGGFVTGASGSDFSQQDSAQFALTGIATSGAGAVFLTASAASSMVGNLCQVISGTNFTAGVYQITSVSVGVSVTVDRACCTGVGASGVINIGGAFATPAKALTSMTVAGHIGYVKATATYNIGTGLSIASNGFDSALIRLIGYTSTRADLGRPTLKATAAITVVTANTGCSVENFILDGNTATGTKGVAGSGHNARAVNCWAKNFSSTGIDFAGGSGLIAKCEVSGCAPGGSGAISVGGMAVDCYAHGNTGYGFVTGGGIVIRCVSASNSLAGFALGGFPTGLHNCVAYGNTQDGCTGAHTTGLSSGFCNNIFVNNGGWGLVGTMTGVDPCAYNNAFYNNTSGAFQNGTLDSSNVTLTGDPFTNAASGDFSLNNTSGAGAACRSVGFPGASPFGTGYSDIGPVRHQDPAGSAGMLFVPSLDGV